MANSQCSVRMCIRMWCVCCRMSWNWKSDSTTTSFFPGPYTFRIERCVARAQKRLIVLRDCLRGARRIAAVCRPCADHLAPHWFGRGRDAAVSRSPRRCVAAYCHAEQISLNRGRWLDVMKYVHITPPTHWTSMRLSTCHSKPVQPSCQVEDRDFVWACDPQIQIHGLEFPEKWMTKMLSGKYTKPKSREKKTAKRTRNFGYHQFCKTDSKICPNPCTATRNNSREHLLEIKQTQVATFSQKNPKR